MSALLVTLGAIAGFAVVGTVGIWVLARRYARGRVVGLFVAGVVALMIIVVATVEGGGASLVWFVMALAVGVAVYVGFSIGWPLGDRWWNGRQVNREW